MTPSPITEADLIAFADGRLDEARAAEVRAWLALPENAEAEARVQQWQTQTELLRGALDPVADEPVPAALSALLEPRRRSRWFIPAIAATLAGVFVGLCGGWAIWGGINAASASELADIGISAHEVFANEVRHPVEVGVDDRTHLVNWLSNRLDFDIEPPDLTSDGLTLLGGRLIPNEGNAAAQLMYEDASGQRYTLFIARNDEPATTALRYAWVEGVCAYYWMDGEIGYVFAGPEDRERVMRLSRLVYDQVS
jgi:anti-sigma factor RsiW